MAWESSDVIRSVRRYLDLLLEGLDDDWEIRVGRREVRDDERPVAVLEGGPEFVLSARETVPQGEVELLHPFTITLYPALPSEEEGEDGIRAAEVAAVALQSIMAKWVMFGLEVRDSKGKLWSGPARFPLWDYAGVPTVGPDRAGPEDPHDVLWINSTASGTGRTSSFAYSTTGADAIRDPEDPRRWTVTMSLRATVQRPGRVRSAEETYVAEGIEGSYVPPPGASP